MENNIRPIFILGDLHGLFDDLFFKIEEHDLKDCYIISAGDIGIGFPFLDIPEEITDPSIVLPVSTEEVCKRLNKLFKRRNIQFLGIRGNHDDPSYFDGNVIFSHFKLLKDYTYLELSGQTFAFAGGAISIDRCRREVGVSYWDDEAFKLGDTFIECDVLITHSAPSNFGPVRKESAQINYWLERDDDPKQLIKDLDKERADIATLVRKTMPRYHYCGHFHMSEYARIGITEHRILNELELYEHRIQSGD